MIKPEHVRMARRVGALAAAIAAVSTIAYAGASAVSKSEDVARRLAVVEARLADLSRLEGKVDALLQFFHINVER